LQEETHCTKATSEEKTCYARRKKLEFGIVQQSKKYIDLDLSLFYILRVETYFTRKNEFLALGVSYFLFFEVNQINFSTKGTGLINKGHQTYVTQSNNEGTLSFLTASSQTSLKK